VENFEALISGKEQEITNKFKEELKRDPGNIFKKFSVSKMDPDAVKAVRAQIEDMAREHVVKKTIIARIVTMEDEKLITLAEQRIAINSMNELNISQGSGARLGPEDSPIRS
jgi:cell division FtsZ-interacting protein ZapD